MELLALFSTAFLVGLSGALMPGPLLTVTIEESTRRGAGAGPLLVLGHGLLELLLVGLLLFGLGGFLTQPVVGRLVAFLGGLVLLWMGREMLKGARTGAVQLQLTGAETAALFPARPAWRAVLAGGVISLANPYWLLWWATIGAAFLAQAEGLGAGGVTSFFSGHILADLGWYSLIAAGVAAGRRFISQRLYQYLIMGCGIFLLILGALFILAGYRGPLNV
ncbi:LysE family transporter [Moorella sp. Hama-1]|uniref:LysE family transporter n=1 Tax=Moorella sp. Hama-1 TaxID=2138101 RepID=UPI000D6556E0|nr:LysE family transporter [Moorella sp. Hama-1]BCV20858.1 lysine transporter LysE [Moorella sp. Hama-1]